MLCGALNRQGTSHHADLELAILDLFFQPAEQQCFLSTVVGYCMFEAPCMLSSQPQTGYNNKIKIGESRFDLLLLNQ